MTLYEASVRARTLLLDAGLQPSTASLDADLLARHALGWDLATWLARRHEPADDRFTRQYEALIARRVTREPVAYIRGVQEFWGREFLVTPAVLIPRPDTELIVELATAHLRAHPGAVVADVGTGSGCIAITLALEHPAATVHAVEISEAAIAIAQANAARFGPPSNLVFHRSSMLSEVPRPLDLIVTNPPYIAERDRAGLSRDVRDFEPAVALFGGEDGWRYIRELLATAPEALAPDGLMLMEMGYGQSEHVEQEIAAVAGIVLQHLAADLQGIPRVASIRRARR